MPHFPVPVPSFGDWIYGSGADGDFTVNAARTVTDGVLDGTGPVLAFESATAAFTAADLNQGIAALPIGNNGTGAACWFRIASVVSATKVLLNAQNGAGSANPPVTGLTVQIGGVILVGQYRNLTIPAGVTARMSYFPYDSFDGLIGGTVGGPVQSQMEPFFCCSDTFTIDGTLDLTGANASDAIAGDSTQNGFGDGCGGTAGNQGTPATGTPPPSTTNPFGSGGSGPAGGQGGNGASGNGGIGGNGGADLVYRPWKFASIILENMNFNNIGGNVVTGTDPSGGAGASGAGDGANSGGAGGEGGQFVVIIARHIIHGAANLYKLQGGNGGNATAGDCGGGGGGGAGWWVTISDTLTGAANTSGIGGLAGAKAGTGTPGGVGSAGIGPLHFLNSLP